MTVHPAYRCFFCFTLGLTHFQYRVLPFGLSTPPALRVFSKLLPIITAYLRKQGVIIFPYLNDCLLKASTLDGALRFTQLTVACFLSLRLQINKNKTTLSPSQHLEFIRAHLDSWTGIASLPPDRFNSIKLRQRNFATVLRSPLKTVYSCFHGLKCTTIHEVLPSLVGHSLQTECARFKQASIHTFQSQRLSPMVDSSLQPLLRSPLSPGCSIPHNDYRCIPHRVGCTHFHHSPGSMVFN